MADGMHDRIYGRVEASPTVGRDAVSRSRYCSPIEMLWRVLPLSSRRRRSVVFHTATYSNTRRPGGGGVTQVQRGAAPALHISRKKGSFFKTACPRYWKRRVLFCTLVRNMGVKIPLQSTKYTRLWRRVTPEVTGLPSLLPPLAAAKHVENFKISS